MHAATISKWGGYGASLFNLICFGIGVAYAVTEGELPDYFGVLISASFVLATLSGVVCLTAALIGSRQRKSLSRHADGGELPVGGA